MKLSSKPTQEAFARYPWLKLGSLVGISFLLIASVFGVWRAFSTPTKIEESVVVLNYEHGGEFDYLVYLKPNSLYDSKQPQSGGTTGGATSVVFFRNIIDLAELAFSYRFEPSEPVYNVTEEVVVTAIAENPGVWPAVYANSFALPSPSTSRAKRSKIPSKGPLTFSRSICRGASCADSARRSVPKRRSSCRRSSSSPRPPGRISCTAWTGC